MNTTPTHPAREAVTLVAGVVALVVALVFAAFLAVELAVRFVPASLEMRVFGGLFAEAAGGDDPRTVTLQNLLDRLAARWQENPYSFRVGIVQEEAPNALAVPGGVILVTTGLLEGLESENALAFVLAHEIGHFRNRDHLRSLGRAAVMSLALGATLGSGLAESVPELATSLTERRFAREQERAADHFSLGLVQAEYGHVAGADGFLRDLPDADADFGERIGAWFSTHPVSAERITALGRVAGEEGWAQEGELVPLRFPGVE